MTTLEKFHWVYASWKAATAVVIVVGAGLPTVILGWDTMLPSGKFVAVAGLLVSGWKALDVIIDQIMRRVSQGKPPMPVDASNGGSGGSGGHTQIIKKDA